MKKVIFVFSSYYNKPDGFEDSFWGLGDLVRGACLTHSIAIDMGIAFDINYLAFDANESLLPGDPCNFYVINSEEDLRAIISNHDEEVLYLATNGLSCWPDLVDEEFKLKIKTMFSELITVEEISYGDIVHFRLGDGIEKSNFKYIIISAALLVAVYLKYVKNVGFILTDSITLKRICVKLNFLQVSSGDIKHSGKKGFLTDDGSFKFDFSAAFFATKIYSFSIYNWESGFMKIFQKIYDKKVTFIYPLKMVKRSRKRG